MQLTKEQKVFIEKLGIRVKAVRLQKKISQAQLAADADIEISQISRIERGVLNTSVANLYAIAKVLGVDIKELVDVRTDIK